MKCTFDFFSLASIPTASTYDGDAPGDAGAGDGQGTGDASGDQSGGGGSGSGEGSGDGGGSGEGLLDNATVNALLAKEKRKAQAELTKYRNSLEETERKLESLQASTVSSTERDEEIEKLRNDLKTQLLTKEQQAEQERQRLRDQHQTELQQVTQELESLKADNLEQQIQGALLRACGQDSFNPAQTSHLLREYAEIVDGEVMMRFTAKGDDGKDLDPGLFTPSDLVKELQHPKYKDDWGNMFKTNIVQGVGGGTADTPSYQPSGPVNYADMTMAEYKKRHAEGNLPHQKKTR